MRLGGIVVTKASINDEWWAEVVRICKANGYAEWFYADRDAWLESSDGMTPQEAVDYQLECAA